MGGGEVREVGWRAGGVDEGAEVVITSAITLTHGLLRLGRRGGGGGMVNALKTMLAPRITLAHGITLAHVRADCISCGFCIFNNVVVGASHALETYKEPTVITAAADSARGSSATNSPLELAGKPGSAGSSPGGSPLDGKRTPGDSAKGRPKKSKARVRIP